MFRYVSYFVLAMFSIVFAGCGGDAETSSSGPPALSSIAANEKANQPVQPKQQLQNESSAANVEPNEVANAKSGAANGLFPDMPLSGFAFGGGLFPDFQPEGDTGETSEVSTEIAEPGDGDMADSGVGASSAESESGDSESANGEPEPEATTFQPVSILHEAKKLFEDHSDQEAIDIVYANYLVSDEARDQYSLDWYPGIKEPRMLFRWGVGIVFNKPRELEGRHPVLGDPGDANEGVDGDSRRRGGRSGGLSGAGGGGVLGGGGARRSGARTYKNIDTSRPDGFVMYYTGDFGEKMISFLDSRRKDDQKPYYGKILKDVMELEIEEKEQDDSASGQSSNRSSLSSQQSAAADFGGGPPAAGGITSRRGGRRGGSSSNSQPLQRTDTSVIDRAMGQSTAEKPADDATGSIIPGVSLLGVGSKAALIERAKETGIDSLIMFNVKIIKSRGSRNRNNTSPEYSCTTSMKIVDVKTGENVFSSKSLKDTKVQEENDDGDDPVKEQVENAFSKVADQSFRAQEMPSGLTAEVIKKRIGKIIASKKENPLAASVEIVNYYKADLLTADLAETALTRLFDSEDAKVLVDGPPMERLEFLKPLLPDGIGMAP